MVRISYYYPTFSSVLTPKALNLTTSIPPPASYTDTVDWRPRKAARWGNPSGQVTVVPNEKMSGGFDMKLFWTLFCTDFRSKDGFIIILGQRQAHGWSETRFKYAQRAANFASFAKKLLRAMYPWHFRNLRPSPTINEQITPLINYFWNSSIFMSFYILISYG